MPSDETQGIGSGAVPPPSQRRIGPYQVVRELGHGGMGVVYLAVRADEHYAKQVAVKVIKGGLDREELIVAFRRERQILAVLEHPNVARLLDGGTTEEGLPYFVMEYVEGEPLDSYCDARRLSTLDRLALFRSVCSAVEYAHRNLVVHRDIKPRNILVTADGTPKLLDFGLAKLITPAAGETASVGMGLTPDYASPEQVRGEPITTASDVYTLGVVLFKLLTGKLPYRARTQNPLDILRAICEDEPTLPSAAVPAAPTAADDVTALAVELVPLTGEATARVKRRLEGDLDTIVLKALRKEPSLRYLSVAAFSDDLRRFIEGRPISARKPTLAYRARKFATRNWPGVTVAAVIALLVAGAAANAVVQAQRVRKEKDKAERVAQFLIGLFKVSDPGEARGNSVTAREILDTGAERIRGELAEEPEVRAALQDTMGSVYKSLGLYDRARPLLEEALATRRQLLGEHVDVATTLHTLANIHYQQGDYVKAEAMGREALALRRKLLGTENVDTAKSMNNLAVVLWEKGDYDGAEALYRETLAIRRRLLGDDDPQVAGSLHNLAIILTDKGDLAGAEAMQRETLAIERRHQGNEHPDVARTLQNLGVVLAQRGDVDGAVAAYREALAIGRKVLGPDHPEVADSLSGLAGALSLKGDHAGAQAAYAEARAVAAKARGDDHVVVAMILMNAADDLFRQGRYAEAEANYKDAQARYRKLFPEGHPNAAYAPLGLAAIRLAQGDPRAAEPLLREALRLRAEMPAPSDPARSEAQSMLGEALAAQGRYAEAEPLLLSSYKALEKSATTRSRMTQDARARVTRVYAAWGKPAPF